MAKAKTPHSSKSLVPDPRQTLLTDAKTYEDRITERIKKKKESLSYIPLNYKIGEAYMKAFRKVNGTTFVVQIPKDILAYLYKYVVENNKAGAAAGLANYNKAELVAAGIEDPDFIPTKENQNSIMIGIWNTQRKSIEPMKVNIAGLSAFEFYDDWNQEWP